MRLPCLAGLFAAIGVWPSLVIVTSLPCAATPLFEPPVFYPVGNVPLDVASGDLNGDGAPDLAVSSLQSQELTVRFNDGAGGFSSELRVPVGAGGQSVAIGDLNGDGHADIALGRQQATPTLAILYNDGAGAFSDPVPVGSFAGFPDGIEILFLDAGDDLDIVVGSPSSGVVAVFLAQAAGGFVEQTFPTATAPAYPSDLAAGDLDQDGDPDLAVSASLSAQTPKFLLNQGGGTLGAPQPFTTEIVALVGVAIGDIDRSNTEDLVLLSFNGGTLDVYRNAGSAVFGLPTQHSIGTSTQPGGKLALGDLDGDGWLDAAVAPILGNPVVPVLLNDRQGALAAATHYPAGQGPSALALTDVDLDTDLDIVVTCKDVNLVAVLENRSLTTTATQGGAVVADAGFWLAPARPNPMRESTAIHFGLPRASHVELAVYDVAGRAIRVLVDRELGSGRHAILWDGRMSSGEPATRGTYFYRLSADPFQATGKLERVR